MDRATQQKHLLYGLVNVFVQAYYGDRVQMENHLHAARIQPINDEGWHKLRMEERAKAAAWVCSISVNLTHEHRTWQLDFRDNSLGGMSWCVKDESLAWVMWALPDPEVPEDPYRLCHLRGELPDDLFERFFTALQTEIRLYCRRHKLWLASASKELLEPFPTTPEET